MKSRITLIMLIIIILILGCLCVFFGINYFNENKTNNTLSSKVDELSTQINDLTNQVNEEKQPEVENELSQENTIDYITTKAYYNDNNTVVLYLIENRNEQYPENTKASNNMSTRFILQTRSNNGITGENSGYYYINNDTLTLTLNQAARVPNTLDDTKNGRIYIECQLNGDKIIYGNEELTQK